MTRLRPRKIVRAILGSLPSAAPTRPSRPPRVVVLTTYFRPVIGGVESTAERLARFLVRSDFDTRVVTKRIGRDLPDREVMDGVRVERIGSHGERGGSGKWRLVPAATRWLVAHRADHDVVCCIDYRGIGCAALAARSVTHRPVVFQAQTGGVLSAGNVDATLERFGIGPTAWAGRVVKSAVTAVYARADAFACISREIERETVAAGIDQERIHFLPNPIDMTQFRPAEPAERAERRQAMGIGPDRVVCVFVGRLSLEKGLMDLLEAWRLLPQTGAARVAGRSIAARRRPGHAGTSLGSWRGGADASSSGMGWGSRCGFWDRFAIRRRRSRCPTSPPCRRISRRSVCPASRRWRLAFRWSPRRSAGSSTSWSTASTASSVRRSSPRRWPNASAA